MTSENEPTDPFEAAYRKIRLAQRAGLPVPKIGDLLPQRPLPLLSLVSSNPTRPEAPPTKPPTPCQVLHFRKPRSAK